MSRKLSQKITAFLGFDLQHGSFWNHSWKNPYFHTLVEVCKSWDLGKETRKSFFGNLGLCIQTGGIFNARYDIYVTKLNCSPKKVVQIGSKCLKGMQLSVRKWCFINVFFGRVLEKGGGACVRTKQNKKRVWLKIILTHCAHSKFKKKIFEPKLKFEWIFGFLYFVLECLTQMLSWSKKHTLSSALSQKKS